MLSSDRKAFALVCKHFRVSLRHRALRCGRRGGGSLAASAAAAERPAPARVPLGVARRVGTSSATRQGWSERSEVAMTSYRTLARVRKNEFVYPKLMAWEGREARPWLCTTAFSMPMLSSHSTTVSRCRTSGWERTISIRHTRTDVGRRPHPRRRGAAVRESHGQLERVYPGRRRPALGERDIRESDLAFGHVRPQRARLSERDAGVDVRNVLRDVLALVPLRWPLGRVDTR